jgi:peroxiredoxin (alkyl hydroperoxide reductase subunit C)
MTTVLVGKQAPNFDAKAVIGDRIEEHFSLSQYIGKKHVVFFFYPKDFTFVCPTELHAFQAHLSEFEARNTIVVGCSTDTEFSHHAWLQAPKNKGGIQGVTYPIVADTNKTIAHSYGVLAGQYFLDENEQLQASSELIAYRGLFLIDKNGVVQHQVVNNMPLGRSVVEAIRMVDALQHFEQFGEVCPMDWHKGQQALKPTFQDINTYLSKQ